jgi:hypothetical protein
MIVKGVTGVFSIEIVERVSFSIRLLDFRGSAPDREKDLISGSFFTVGCLLILRFGRKVVVSKRAMTS